MKNQDLSEIFFGDKNKQVKKQYDAILKSWVNAGKPTDINEIRKFLYDLKVGKNIKKADVFAKFKVPFQIGKPEFDQEAIIAFYNNGKEGFLEYWNKKKNEIENFLQTDPSAAKRKLAWDSAYPIIQKAVTNKKFEKAISILNNVTNLKQSARNNITDKINLLWFEHLLNLKNISAAKALLPKFQQSPNETIDEIKKKIDDPKLDKVLTPQQKNELKKNVFKLAESRFKTLSRLLKENNITWKTLGYSRVVRDSGKKTVTLIEYASGGGTSSGNIASVPNAGMMPLIKRMPPGQSFFAPQQPQPQKKRKKKHKK